MIYYNNADYKSALPYFEKASGLYPFDYYITLMYAWVNLKLMKYTEAKALFNTVLLIEPNDASAMEGLKAIK
ncbi:MAG: tetratricopeptide repeat protein [Bacteroidales bacterium]